MIARLRSADPGSYVLAALIAAFVIHFGSSTLDIHHGLGTASYDSALYDQGVWLLSRFDAPFVTLMGRNLFGDHTSFILVCLVPLYWVAPGAWILFWSQAAVIAAGAVPVYLYARRRLRSSGVAVGFAAVYLAHPAVLGAVYENYHPDSFLGLFVPLALWAALERRWRWYGIAVVGALLVKEDVALVIVPLGVWVALNRRRRIGLVTVVASVGATVVAMFVVMRSLIGVPTRNTWRIPFGGPWGFISTAFTDPTAVIDHLRSDGRLWYLWQMGAPFGLVFLRRPAVAAISGVVLFTNILSTYWYQYQVQYHYSVVAVPALVFGTIWALGELAPRGLGGRRVALATVFIASAVTAWLWSPLPGMRSEPVYWPPDHPVAVAARDAIAQVPSDAPVAAHYRITPHLAYRSEIYQFPTPFRVVLYGTDIADEGSREAARAEGVEYLVLQATMDEQAAMDFAAISAAFVEDYGNEFWTVWRRDPSVPLPPPPSSP